MNLPGNAANILKELDIPFETEISEVELLNSRLKNDQPRRAILAQVSLLQTDSDKIQLITSANALCRLDMIAEQLGQKITTLAPETTQKLVNIAKLETLSAIPEASSFRVLVDSGLFETEEIYLPSGLENIHLRISAEDFRRLVAEHEVINADLPLESLEQNLACPKSDAEQLQKAIRNYTSRKIEKSLSETMDIPPLSHTAQKVIILSTNPDADIDDLAHIVEQDPSLTAQVVGWAASPYYSAPGQVTSIRDAISRVLGYELVLSLAIGLSVGKSLQVPKDCPRGASAFWRQSVYCALTMEKLNFLLPPDRRVSRGLCYISGLLNNFGYLILAHVFKDHFSQLCRYQEVNLHLHPSLIETYLLGICRDQMSGQLMQHWNLPKEICTALRFQQVPEYRGDHHTYANLCFMAQRLLAAKGIGDSPASFIPADLYTDLDISPSFIEEALAEVMASSVEVESMTRVFTN